MICDVIRDKSVPDQKRGSQENRNCFAVADSDEYKILPSCCEAYPTFNMILFQALEFIDQLEKDLDDDEEWQKLSDERKALFESFVYAPGNPVLHDTTFRLDENFDKKQLWNVCEERFRKSVTEDAEKLELVFYLAVHRMEIVRQDILYNFEKHVLVATERNKDHRAMDLLRFYGTFNASHDVSPPLHSYGTLKNDSSGDCRSSAITSVLKADRIHHNMFRDKDSEINCQKFKRFKIGGQLDPDLNLETLISNFGLNEQKDKLMSFLPEALANLQHARSFLARRGGSRMESLTQTVFYVFLSDLMEKMNSSFCSQSNGNVAVVAGMDAVEVEVTVCKEYMRRNAKKQKLNSRCGVSSQKTKLQIKSDVVILEGRTDKYNQDSVGIQQQKVFLDSKVNIEIKEWGLLANLKNKSPMTQVAAESMARSIKKNNKKNDGWLFSLLTDCMVLYCVCHNVAKQEYWISRSVQTPEEMLLSICWLHLKSIGIVQVGTMDRWETDEWSDGEVEEEDDEVEDDEGKTSSVPEEESIDDAINEPANDEQKEQIILSAEIFDYIMNDNPDEEEEEMQREKWQTFFLMENHRKYGTPLPLTEKFLSLHNATDNAQA